MLITNTPAKPQPSPLAGDIGKTISMPQALALLAQRRPLAKPLPKIVRKIRP